jgi:hypothetical protein
MFARGHTLTLLPRLDGERKGSVVQFLYEAGFIGWYHDGSEVEPVLDLRGADLEEATLSGVTLSGAVLDWSTLSEADLSGADLSKAELFDANLSEADLGGADLWRADLRRADLRGAYLGGADLSEATLQDAVGMTNEELAEQASSLKDSTMPNGQKYEEWIKDKEGRGENGE